MSRQDYAICPRCGKEARGERRVDQFFGLRNNHGYLMVQSYCRQCRIEKRAEKRLAKKRIER